MSALRGYSPTRRELTRRHLDVLRLKARGLTNREVGLELHVSEGTVRSELASAFARLEARNTANAVWLARADL